MHVCRTDSEENLQFLLKVALHLMPVLLGKVVEPKQQLFFFFLGQNLSFSEIFKKH